MQDRDWWGGDTAPPASMARAPFPDSPHTKSRQSPSATVGCTGKDSGRRLRPFGPSSLPPRSLRRAAGVAAFPTPAIHSTVWARSRLALLGRPQPKGQFGLAASSPTDRAEMEV